MKADYELRHKLFGQQGSMWERQVTPEARTQLRKIVKTAGNAATLGEIDQIAAGPLNAEKVLVEDVYFRFVDGDFAVVGRHQDDYDHSETTLADGSRLHFAYRSGGQTISGDAIPTALANVTKDFTEAVKVDEGALPVGRDWYLVPVDEHITPLVIQGRQEDVFLVNGIDFLARDGYIILADDPGAVLPHGLVKVPSAYRAARATNSYVLSAPNVRGGTRYLAEYAYKSQSLTTFRRAAAEYAGLYVFQEADVVMGTVQISADHWVYNMAAAGPIEIRYPHVALVRNQEVSPGYIICQQFDITTSNYNGSENLLRDAALAGWDHPICLDGILPVKGLQWNGVSGIKIDSVATDPVSSTPHVRLHFTEDTAGPHFDSPGDVLSRFWEFSRLHEATTQEFLFDGLGSPNMPSVIDFWDLLDTFYGAQLMLVLAEEHTPTIDTRLQRFLLEHRPKSCNILFSIRRNLPYDVIYDDQGIPLVDEYGAYVPAYPPPCVDNLLSFNGDILAINGNPLTYEICPCYDDPLVFGDEILDLNGNSLTLETCS